MKIARGLNVSRDKMFTKNRTFEGEYRDVRSSPCAAIVQSNEARRSIRLAKVIYIFVALARYPIDRSINHASDATIYDRLFIT